MSGTTIELDRLAERPEGRRLLVDAGDDRACLTAAEFLRRQGYEIALCPDLHAGLTSFDASVGAVLMAAPLLAAHGQTLRATLAADALWSDIPILTFVERPGDSAAASVRGDGSLNVVMLETPINPHTLTSVLRLALRSRQKQFLTRDTLADLHASKMRFEAITNSIDQMIWSTRPDGFHDFYNRRWYEYTGMPVGSTDGEAWNGMFHPDDQERAWALWRHCLVTGDPYEIEYRLRHRSGEYRWVLGRAQPMRDAGQIVRWFGTCTEIHELVTARQALGQARANLETMVEARTAALEHEMASRLQAEAALRQSQKMEAVGQLTGGIAHDFNNMLTGVIGSLDIVRRRLTAGRMEDVEKYLDAASASAHRAAALTARLLAFSRRQSLDSKPTDLNALVLGLESLTRQTLNESITLQFDLAIDLPAGIADSNQLENAILNLAINARDAMPDGGILTIRTSAKRVSDANMPPGSDLRPGEYVVITMTDTGVGMEASVLEKVFDPFYTTKPLGQGTGLGLSMVYGFAKQNGGGVTATSQPGRGTAIDLFLPRAETAPTTAVDERRATAVQGRGELILVVEDDDTVRQLVLAVLGEAGYRTISCDGPHEAIDHLAGSVAIDLMISDVGLPGLNGRQLAEIARAMRPELPVLFITGYAETAAMRGQFLAAGMSILAKPFPLDELASTVDTILGGRPGSSTFSGDGSAARSR